MGCMYIVIVPELPVTHVVHTGYLMRGIHLVTVPRACYKKSNTQVQA